MRKFGLMLLVLLFASNARADRLPRACADRPETTAREFRQFQQVRRSLYRASDMSPCGTANEAGVIVALRMLDAIQYQGDDTERAVYHRALRDALNLFWRLDARER